MYRKNDERLIGITPHKRQIAHQSTEFYSFVHFTVNTFTNREWGDGKESPAIFNPTRLDTEQWVKAVKSAGMKGLILTCKHHDGFCLWPSRYTEHSIKNSPYKNGKGDIVREFADACRRGGIKFGFYLSPWDRNCELYGTDAYNDFYRAQLTELLTNYGDVFCVSLDGASDHRKNAKFQPYDWVSYFKLIRELQPDATINICGPDVRWCGNEAGVCRKSEWNVVPYWHSNQELIAAQSQKDVSKPPKKINPTALDLGSRKAIKKCNKLIWYPAEVDVSIRKGWFYHPEEDYSVKPLSKLMDIYYSSVGSNASFLLNIPPDTNGRIAEKEVETLLSMGAQLEIDFNENLAEGSIITDNRHLDENHTGQMALSDNSEEYWHSGDDPDGAELILDLGDEYDIDKIVLGEHIKTGQQIEKFTLYAQIKGKWKKLASETVIGHKRICRFDEIRVRYFKVVIEKARCFATISKFEAY